MNDQLIIEKIIETEIPEASALLAESMSTNPNHIAIFGPASSKAIERQRRMFEMVLKNTSSKIYVAKLNGEIAGVMAYMHSDHCQMQPLQLLRGLPKFARMFGTDLLPVLRWRMKWAQHDCRRTHIHFGPLAVAIRHQGRGIGKALLNHFISYLDATQQAGYLETDKFENVSLYQKFGFEVSATDKLYGQVNWFMTRGKSLRKINGAVNNVQETSGSLILGDIV